MSLRPTWATHEEYEGRLGWSVRPCLKNKQIKTGRRTEQVTQLVKCWLRKRKSLNSDPQSPQEEPDVTTSEGTQKIKVLAPKMTDNLSLSPGTR